MEPATPAAVSETSTIRALAYFWTSFAALTTLRAALLHMNSPGAAFLKRCAIAAFGALLSWLVAKVATSRRVATSRMRLGVLLVASVPAAFSFAFANFLVFDVFASAPGEACGGAACGVEAAVQTISDASITWAFVFLAWGLLFNGLLIVKRARTAEMALFVAQLDAAREREATRAAELRALRYQINPHFLFNVLNSLSALVRRSDADEAEGFIADIGSFFREALSADAAAEHRLADEVSLQMHYLALEQRRFSDRLVINLDIDPAILDVPIPVMLLQPIIENTIKHGVSHTGAVVTIQIRAQLSSAGTMQIDIADDAAARSDKEGVVKLGVGLANVRERLQRRFGEAAHLSTKATGSGFMATLRIPILNNPEDRR